MAAARPRITDNVGIMNRGGDRGRALAGLAGRQRGPAHAGPRRTPATRRSSTSSTTGCAATRRGSTPTATALYDEAGPDDHGAALAADRRGGDEAAVRRPGRRRSTTSATSSGLSGESYVDKDLRTLLGEKVEGPFNLCYCGKGKLAACRASLWEAVHASADAARRGARGADPAQWLTEADTTGFAPGLLPTPVPDDEPPDLPAGPRVPALGPTARAG